MDTVLAPCGLAAAALLLLAGLSDGMATWSVELLIHRITPLAFVVIVMALALHRSGGPDSMRSLAIMYAEEQYRAWGDMIHSVQTGKTAFERQFGASYFAYLAQHPAANHVFNEAQSGHTKQVVTELSALAAAALIGGQRA